MQQVGEVQMADVRVTLSLQRKGDPSQGCCCLTAIKAIRWVHRVTDSEFLGVSQGPLISSFLNSKVPRDRKESMPLPLFALVQFERRILSRKCPQHEILVLGALPATCWASLRFADSQRVRWDSLAFDISSSRGVCFQTKTSHQGQPFGLLASGVLSHGSHSWAVKYLQALDALAIAQLRDWTSEPIPAFCG